MNIYNNFICYSCFDNFIETVNFEHYIQNNNFDIKCLIDYFEEGSISEDNVLNYFKIHHKKLYDLFSYYIFKRKKTISILNFKYYFNLIFLKKKEYFLNFLF